MLSFYKCSTFFKIELDVFEIGSSMFEFCVWYLFGIGIHLCEMGPHLFEFVPKKV